MAIAAGALLGSPAAADTRKLTADGVVHTIEVQNVGGGKSSGSALRHLRYGPGLAAQSILVPGTEDTVVDREPAIEIDPVSGKLVLVWSRYDGNNYNVFVSRFSGTAWSTPVAVHKAAGDDVEPQIRISDHYVHVSWRQVLAGVSTFYRSSLLSTTLAAAYGPESIRADEPYPVPAEGAVSSSYDPLPGDEYFAGVLYTSPTEPGRCHIWGVRDEPVPIGYRECLLLPSTARAATSVEAGFLGGRFTVWYVSGSRFYYATRVDGTWSPTRTIELSAGVTVGDARWIVSDLNSRSGPD